MKKFNKKSILLTIIIILTTASIFLVFLTSTKNNQYKDADLNQISYFFDTQKSFIPEIETGHYALWGINDKNEKIILKRFNFKDNNFYSLNGEILNSLILGNDFIFENYEITVESVGDRNTEQSGCILFNAKRFENNLNFQLYPIANSQISASFILATFTDNTSTTNEKSGIWFTDKINDETNTFSSISLPDLKECWIWSAYVFYQNQYLKIGEFKSKNTSDNFQEYSFFSQKKINVPGEDFVTNLPKALNPPINISNKGNRAVIALKPSDFSLYSKDKPFIEIMNYTFTGEEIARSPIKMGVLENYSLQIKIN